MFNSEIGLTFWHRILSLHSFGISVMCAKRDSGGIFSPSVIIITHSNRMSKNV